MQHHNENEHNFGPKYILPDSSMQALRLQRETDFLKYKHLFSLNQYHILSVLNTSAKLF